MRGRMIQWWNPITAAPSASVQRHYWKRRRFNAGMSQGHKISPLATRHAVKLWQISHSEMKNNRQVTLDGQYGGNSQTLASLLSF